MSHRPLVIGAIAAAALTAACNRPAGTGAATGNTAQADQCAARLATFDTLDFVAFTGQRWDRFHESHSDSITVTWPDGHETHGLARHIEDLKGMFVYAPNTSILEHPVRICSGDYTSVTGIMTGTFSQPMPGPNGRAIAPTNKAFRLGMATIGHWNGTVMDHEWLFWDNQTYMQQIGLAP